jgi:hypothetical protein
LCAVHCRSGNRKSTNLGTEPAISDGFGLRWVLRNFVTRRVRGQLAEPLPAPPALIGGTSTIPQGGIIGTAPTQGTARTPGNGMRAARITLDVVAPLLFRARKDVDVDFPGEHIVGLTAVVARFGAAHRMPFEDGHQVPGSRNGVRLNEDISSSRSHRTAFSSTSLSMRERISAFSARSRASSASRVATAE